MRKHLNTLYVTSPGSVVSKEGATLVVRLEGERKLGVPVLNLEGLVCFGNVTVTPFALGLCGRSGVAVSFLSRGGRFLGRVTGPRVGNVLLRRTQYRRSDDPEESARLARWTLLAKLANCRTVLMRTLRDYPNSSGARELRTAVAGLAGLLKALDPSLPLDVLRGLEGAAARLYFGVFDLLILQQRETFPFPKRSRRPPRDRANALLSFLYTVLTHDLRSALESNGLDPFVGFLHRDRPGRPSLALDMLEELRPVVADRLALSLINRRELGASHFETSDAGGVSLNDQGRKVVLTAYQKRKDQHLTHPFIGEETTYGMIPHLQALLLSRYLRGDLDAYPAFLWK